MYLNQPNKQTWFGAPTMPLRYFNLILYFFVDFIHFNYFSIF